MTRSEQIAADVAALLRARNPLLWIVSREEARAESYLFEAAATAGYIARTWDVAQGFMDMDGKAPPFGGIDTADPSVAFRTIIARSQNNLERGVWIMRDLPVWLSGLTGAATCRQLRNLARALPSTPRDNAQAIIIMSPTAELPPELAGHATVIEWPLPDRQEIAAILDDAIAGLPEGLREGAAQNGTRDAAIDAAIGLTGNEAAGCYAKSLVQLKRIDPTVVAREKRRVIAREGMLEWYDPIPGGLDAVGGLDVLKGWLASRKNAYSAKAREYGLPAPRGALLVGVPGCGKSLTAKAIATAWGVPLLRLDLGGLKSKFVGESEGNLRKAFDVIAAIGRCVVWLDEIEKALAGATQGAADGGVSSDALGAVLSWMQERQGEAFVIATSNDVTALPPELLRKGRFDELWFVDLPTMAERVEIVRASLKAHGRGTVKVDVAKVAGACENFTGSEIAALVPDALYTAFAEKAREITTADLMTAAGAVVPLAKTAADKIGKLREWSVGRARPATSRDATDVVMDSRTGKPSRVRQLDVA